MFLSFIVPVYNAEQYLEECLESLLKQDIAYDAYEIICINDGSTDKSLEILNNYRVKYCNIIVVDKENSGVSVTRNKGLEIARGKYVWFVDADDFIEKNILYMFYLLTGNKNIDVFQLGAYTFADSLTLEETTQYENGELQPKSYANNVFVTRNIFKKQFLDCNKIRFYTELSYSEDKVFVSEVLTKNPTIELVKRTCYYYRYHAGQQLG